MLSSSTTLAPALDGLRRFVPHVTVLLLLTLSFTPFPLFSIKVAPPLTLLGVCFWSVRRPDRFGILAAFSIGLLQDLLAGTAPGVTAFCYAMLQRIALRQHGLLHGLSFLLAWSLFGAIAVSIALIQWLLWSWLVPQQMLSMGPFLLQACLGIVLFPLVSWILLKLQAATFNTGRAA